MHSKELWAVNDIGKGTLQITNEPTARPSEHGYRVVALVYEDMFEPARSHNDARLLAQAPALIGALERIVEILEGRHPDTPRAAHWRAYARVRAVKEARAAIAAVRGTA